MNYWDETADHRHVFQCFRMNTWPYTLYVPVVLPGPALFQPAGNPQLRMSTQVASRDEAVTWANGVLGELHKTHMLLLDAQIAAEDARIEQLQRERGNK